ncbi:MAG TPA: hypothetical protein VIP51_10785, partial [Eoetvoesiella sp.]
GLAWLGLAWLGLAWLGLATLYLALPGSFDSITKSMVNTKAKRRHTFVRLAKLTQLTVDLEME